MFVPNLCIFDYIKNGITHEFPFIHNNSFSVHTRFLSLSLFHTYINIINFIMKSHETMTYFVHDIIKKLKNEINFRF